MDRVRLGRALGAGTRHIARTALEVTRAVQAPASNAGPTIQPPAASPRRGVAQTASSALPIAKAGVNAGRTSFRAVRRAAGVVWLQVMGTFFALFAVSLAGWVWKCRAWAHAGLHSHEFLKLAAYSFFCALFAWFALSSFLRARQRERSH
jgi:hypothetical protein